MNRDQFFKLLQEGTEIGAKGFHDQEEGQLKQNLLKKKQQLDLESQDAAIKKAKALAAEMGQMNPGHKYNVSVGNDSATLSESQAQPNLLAEMRKTSLNDKAMKDLTDRYQKQNGFTSALNELEAKTNRDGKGGILTNPEASLKSTGTWKSAVPTGALGIAELFTGDKGMADERKALERLQIEYQQAKNGVRVSDQAREQEKQAMGWLASGDPALVAKGVRSLAHVVKNSLTTTQAGFRPDIRDSVHQTMGDPLDNFRGLYDDNTPPQQTPPSPPGGGGAGDIAKKQARLKELQAKMGAK